MDRLFAQIPPRDGRGRVNVIIDTPRGSRNKIKFDEALGCFRLSRILPAGHVFPCDFGSVPGTLAEDGDALDVLVLLEWPLYPGCLVRTRLLGGLAARQGRGRSAWIRNDRLIAVPETSVNKPRARRLADLEPALLDDLEHFFVSYNRAQGRRFEALRRLDVAGAERVLARAIRQFRKG